VQLELHHALHVHRLACDLLCAGRKWQVQLVCFVQRNLPATTTRPTIAAVAAQISVVKVVASCFWCSDLSESWCKHWGMVSSRYTVCKRSAL
jgi:hypothetical protein